MSTVIEHNTAKQRYEIHVDGVFAGFAKAHERGDEVLFPHTVVFDEFEGQGVGGTLVSGALDDVRSRGKKVIAECEYVSNFISKHDEYADLRA
jgi:hypothetical protein